MHIHDLFALRRRTISLRLTGLCRVTYLLLYKPCMRGHPAAGKYALLCYLSCYCTSLVYEDTLQQKSTILLCYLSCYCTSLVCEDTVQQKSIILLCYLVLYCASLVCNNTLQLESMHCCVTCLVTVQVLYARTPCSWEVCIAMLLVIFLSSFNTSFVCEATLRLRNMHCCAMRYFVILLYKHCMREHPATGKYALLRYLSVYCTRFECEDTLRLRSMHWCVTCLIPCNWKVSCIAAFTVQALNTRTPGPATEKCALLRYLSFYCISLVCEDTLRLRSMHC